MRKFLQWGLVTVVAIVLLAAVVGQILATSTGRAREASVAVLKEKLARLEAERVAAEPVAAPEKTASVAGARIVPLEPSANESQLRARWLAAGDDVAKAWNECGLVPPQSREGGGEAGWTPEQREEFTNYLACLSPAKGALLKLINESGELGRLLNPSVLWQNSDYIYGISYCEDFLNWRMLSEGLLEDYRAGIDSLEALVRLREISLRSSRRTFVKPAMTWGLVRTAIESGAIDDARWDQFLQLLGEHRKEALFFQHVQGEAAELVYRFENWKTVPRDLKLSENPVSYVRTWAYPRLTPALFNHDFNRFNRAMNGLLDLADRPYFEVKEDLEQFCKDFDVEPDRRHIKFTRGNPGWRYVLTLSRHGFEQNAQEQASMDVIRIAILLDRHRRSTGNYPESLDDLAGAFAGSLPVNPLMGDSYVYERTEDSFRLGFREETNVAIREQGFGPTMVTWWHEPLGVEVEDVVE